MQRVHVIISGRVQGVYYRQACANEARARQVKGFVRNLHDGRVEAVFEGEPDAVQEMVRWCHRGPSEAVVEKVEFQESTPIGEKKFEVQP